MICTTHHNGITPGGVVYTALRVITLVAAKDFRIMASRVVYSGGVVDKMGCAIYTLSHTIPVVGAVAKSGVGCSGGGSEQRQQQWEQCWRDTEQTRAPVCTCVASQQYRTSTIIWPFGTLIE